MQYKGDIFQVAYPRPALQRLFSEDAKSNIPVFGTPIVVFVKGKIEYHIEPKYMRYLK